jgi:hypothetical protein
MPINSIAPTTLEQGRGLDRPPGNPLGALSEFRLGLRRAIAASHHRNEEHIERECHDASTKNLLARALPALPAAASRMRRRRRGHPRRRRECGDGRQDVASLGRISGLAERQPELRQLPAVPGTECLQERRRHDQSAGLVQNLGKSLSTRRALLMSINSRVVECYSVFPTQAFWRAS